MCTEKERQAEQEKKFVVQTLEKSLKDIEHNKAGLKAVLADKSQKNVQRCSVF